MNDREERMEEVFSGSYEKGRHQKKNGIMSTVGIIRVGWMDINGV